MKNDTKIRISKSELIKTFSEIDNKINSLYRRSTSDFMQLNNYLKDYHRKTRIIASNAFRIIETISGEKDTNLIKELGKINYRLDDCIEKINEEDIRKIQNLKEIIHKSNQCNILIQNLRQDLTTFKFLSSNFNIMLNYRDFGRENSEIENSWGSHIKALKESLLVVSTHTEIFREQITSSITCIDSRIKSSMDIFRSLSQETRTNISSVVIKSLESKLHLPTLKEKTNESSRRIDDIIKHLQYHDIICQKIDHIQKSHRRVIEEMGQQGDTLGSHEDCLPEDCARVCDIIDLQSAQLLLVSKEYQNALDVITGNFLGVAKEVTAISGISDKLSFRDNGSQFTIIRQIKDLLDKGIIMLDLHNFNEINEEFSVAGKNLEVILEDVAAKIHPLITGFVSRYKIIRKCRQDDADPGILKEMNCLVDSIELRYNDLTEKLNNIKELYDNIFSPDLMDTEDYRLEMDRLQLMVSISKILESIDRDNEELDIVLNQNKDLNDSILEKIESAINRKDYYEYFESIVEEVIDQLNEINNRIKPEETSSDSGKAENLEHMKAAYTMASERTVHENVVSGGEPEITSQEQEPDNEVEFF